MFLLIDEIPGKNSVDRKLNEKTFRKIERTRANRFMGRRLKLVSKISAIHNKDSKNMIVDLVSAIKTSKI